MYNKITEILQLTDNLYGSIHDLCRDQTQTIGGALYQETNFEQGSSAAFLPDAAMINVMSFITK